MLTVQKIKCVDMVGQYRWLKAFEWPTVVRACAVTTLNQSKAETQTIITIEIKDELVA